jgi:hypothetical protein
MHLEMTDFNAAAVTHVLSTAEMFRGQKHLSRAMAEVYRWE